MEKQFNKISLRLKGHAYNGGMYFVTICVQNRKCVFGLIHEGKMFFSTLGKYADEQFRTVSQHYSYAEIPLWVIMPNHIHAIVIIDKKADEVLQKNNIKQNISQNSKISPRRGTLAVVIRGIKSAVTRYAHIQHIPFSWQSLYYEHIIRNNNELNNIALYIENNVLKWEWDRLYK